MSSISSSSYLLGSFFSSLTTSTYGWTTGSIAAAMKDINGSQFLVDELEDLQSHGWILLAAPQGQTYTDVDNIGKGTIVISYDFGGQAFSPAPGVGSQQFDVPDFFVGALSYEIGHAEDPQGNTEEYATLEDTHGDTLGGTDLALGANVALNLFGEGKSVLNNVSCATQSYQSGKNNIAILVPYTSVQNDLEAGDTPQAIIDGAISTGLQNPSGGDLFVGYWNDYLTLDLPLIEVTAPYQIYDALKEISIGPSSIFTLSQNADGTDSMTVTAGTGTIQTYIVDFGNYGSLAASGVTGQTPDVQYKSPSPNTSTTYQEFTFTNGDLLKEEYIFNSGTVIAGTQASETLIGQGTFAGMEAGGSLDTLIDLSGTSSAFKGEGYSSLTEEALNGTSSTKNVFKFDRGTNVLIGDLGHNTFVENLSASNAVNIIYGGGGVSTYELSGLIDILYTTVTPTPQQIESLNSNSLAATIPSGVDYNTGENITYIIDPGPKDVLELPSYTPIYTEGDPDPGGYTQPASYSSVAGPYKIETPVTSGYISADFQNGSLTEFEYNPGYVDPEDDEGYILLGQGSEVYGAIGSTGAGVVVNDYVPDGFGIAALKSGQAAFQKFISLPSSDTVPSISVSSGSKMALLKPVLSAMPDSTLLAPDIAAFFLRRADNQMGVFGGEKIHSPLGPHTIDLISSAGKWIPTMTIQT